MPSAQTILPLTAEQVAMPVTAAILTTEDIIGDHGRYPKDIAHSLSTICEFLQEVKREVKQSPRAYLGWLELADENGVRFSERDYPSITAGFLLAVMESSAAWGTVMKHGPEDYCFEQLNMLRTAVYALLFKRSLAG